MSKSEIIHQAHPSDGKEEWIDGVYNMTPAASPEHNIVLNEMHMGLANYLIDKKCQLFRENVDLLLADPTKYTAKELQDLNRENKVRPDLLVFCEKRFVISRNNIVGIPDFIVEVLSPGSSSWDKKVKLKKYLDAGVKEYWIVDYNNEEVLVYRNDRLLEHSWDLPVKVGIFEDFEVDFPLIKKQLSAAWWL